MSLDDESLALDVIHEVGPGGQFISHDHTLSHWRELWVPKLFDRTRLDRWEARGSKDTRTRTRDLTVALMEVHRPAPLAASVDAELEAIMAA